ncbi:NRPS-like enzyme [Apiospora arundinis]
MVTSFGQYGQGGNQPPRGLLPHILDQTASTDPDAIYGMWPVDPTSYKDGFRSVTFAQLANAVNGLAQWLLENLGQGPGQGRGVLAYVGPNDVRIPALTIAAVKTGYSLFLTSPRNSPEAHRSLFESLSCKTLITTAPTPPPAQVILEAVAPRHLTVPSVDELLHTAFPPCEYQKTLEEGRDEPLFIIHTSGSTGIPKPLVWSLETIIRHQNASSCPAPDGVPSLDGAYLGKRVLVTVPPFHGAGLGQTSFYAIPFGNTIIAPAAAAIVTAQGLVEALKQTPADIALLVPSVVAELAQNPDLLRYCAKHLELIVYIGGDLPQPVGDVVAAAVPLRCQWGASEVGMPQQLIAPGLDPRRDWKYVRFHPCTGAAFQKATDGGLYELVLQRREELAGTQPTFTIRGKEHLAEYRTRDLFAPHPTVPDAWAWQARADDIVVFLNGEKTNPVTMEHHVVSSHPGLLSGALVVGTHRFQAALLLEPRGPVRTTAEQADLIERVWPSIQEANRAAPAHARVEKMMVLVADPERPLVRAGKGTLQRGVSAALYAAEIDTLYENAEKVDHDEDESTVVDEEGLEDVGIIARRIREAVLRITDWTLALDDSESLFDHGMDSLQALQLTRALQRALHRPQLGLSTIYQNPTISELAVAVTATRDDSQRDDRDIMEPLLATYRQLIKEIPMPNKGSLSSPSSREAPRDVLLTGSTGTLGTMILRSLLSDPNQAVSHVFCLNRSPDGGRSAQVQKWAGLSNDAADVSLLEERVTFLQANLAHPQLGLDPATYETLRSRVGHVIHSAWPVNFNLALSAFRPHLAGMVNLFTLAASAPHRLSVMFISSVGAVAGSKGAAPESIVDTLDAAHANGYSRSKLMSELLCDTASRHLGIPVSIARVGQVAGQARSYNSSGGVIWNRSEWLPSLVISSFRCLGCLPANLGPRFSQVDWMPSDLAGEVIASLATTSVGGGEEGPDVFNLRNPSTTTWTELLPAIQDAARVHLGKELEVVSPATWLARLSESGERDMGDASSTMSNPAIKLLAFYRDGLWADGPAAEPMAVEKSSKASAALREMPAVHADWMRRWIDDWLAES